MATNERSIVCEGRKEARNESYVLRFVRDDQRKNDIYIRSGQVLTVGKDITTKEADKLLNNPTWEFKEVKANGE